MHIFFLIWTSVIWDNCSRYIEEKLLKFPKKAGILIINRDFDTPSTFIFSIKWMTFTERGIHQKLYKT